VIRENIFIFFGWWNGESAFIYNVRGVTIRRTGVTGVGCYEYVIKGMLEIERS
jgi:hypothetical protein